MDARYDADSIDQHGMQWYNCSWWHINATMRADTAHPLRAPQTRLARITALSISPDYCACSFVWRPWLTLDPRNRIGHKD